MANNLKKFQTEADYSAATLNYPAVSWVVSGDTVHFDKSGSTPTVNDKVMMAFLAISNGLDIVMFNSGASIEPTAGNYFTSITLNDVDVYSQVVGDTAATLYNYSVAGTDYLAKYGISGTTINDYFAGVLGGGWSSNPEAVDFLVPAQITAIDHLPENIQDLVIEATTPPTWSFEYSAFEHLTGIYVPTESVNAYKTAFGNDFADKIYPISDYQGNLPV
ncbi:MAG: hypothetical protein J6S67_09285 [Methanobrevibacter sp.]|nr:hypothetical protein [Methanobrevibacter sp.]